MKFNYKISILLSVSFLILICSLILPRYPDSPSTNLLADQRCLMHIENFMNVFSNLLFLFFGLWGLFFHLKLKKPLDLQRLCWMIFFIAIICLTFGSMYYHLRPNNDRLVWDRIPLVLSLISLFSALLIERTGSSWIMRFTFPFLMILGIISVVYWWGTERVGEGNIKFYLFIQYYMIIILPLLCLFYPKKGDKYIYISLVLYGIAKIFELQDSKIFVFTQGIISGHTLKHFICALGVYFVHLKSVAIYNKH